MAHPGEYLLRSTVEVVEGPDFIASLNLANTTPKLVAKRKQSGFDPFL